MPSAHPYWIYKKCSGVKGSLEHVDQDQYRCVKCTVGGNPAKTEVQQQQQQQQLSLEVGLRLECVEKFCYLGDMIGQVVVLERQSERE